LPSIQIRMRKGCDDASIEKSMMEITSAAANTLENTLTRMVRISIFESEKDVVFQGGKLIDSAAPTVTFGIGPGRSKEAIVSFTSQIAVILHNNLACPKEDVRVYVEYGPADHFAIGGKLKDFSKKVK
jgi:phenylpyruvate tautomerase PptA (4-oxalocrotonate tautomerase family)